MRQLNAAEDNAGLAALYTLTTTGVFEHYLHTLHDKFILRSVIDMSSKAITDAFPDPEDEETPMLRIRERARSRADGPDLAALVREAVTHFEQFIVSKGGFRGFLRGLTNWTG